MLKLLVAILFILDFGSPTEAAAKNRVAFLVGNSNYENAQPLRNPIRDVTLIGETLISLDFTVVTHHDLSRKQIGKELTNFLKQYEGADLTLFYFAGHGMQYDKKNFLVGVEAKLETEFDIESEALDLDRVVQLMKKSSKASLVFIDACRDNPLASQFYKTNFSETRALMTRGLAPIQSSYDGAMITFSASPGQVASDGDEHSPFAESLAKHLQSQNMEILTLMKRVIRDVKEKSGNKQIPLVSNDLTAEIYLKLSSEGTGSSITFKQEEAMFNAAMSIQSIRAWDLFLKRFPEGLFKDLALIESERLRVVSFAEASGINVERLDTSKPIKIKRDVAMRAEKSLGLTKVDAKKVQQALNIRGYAAGVVDGAIGAGTRKAVADFQAGIGLPSTGVITAATASALDIGLDKAEASEVAIFSSSNARRFNPKEISLVENDPRIIKAAKVLSNREFVYGYHNGNLYIAILTWGGQNWNSANDMATAIGGYLASITSKEENNFVYDLVSNDERFWQKCSENAVCVLGPNFGLHQVNGSKEPSGGWSWTTGEKLNYRNWHSGYPSNHNGDAKYGMFHYQTPLGTTTDVIRTSKKWADNASVLNGIVVEID